MIGTDPDDPVLRRLVPVVGVPKVTVGGGGGADPGEFSMAITRSPNRMYSLLGEGVVWAHRGINPARTRATGTNRNTAG